MDYEEDEDYTYEEDGEYDEGEEEYEEDYSAAIDDGMITNETSNGPGSAHKSSSPTPLSMEKRLNDQRGLVVPSDSYNILDCSEIEPIMLKMIEDVASLLDLNKYITQSLLQNNKWDREKLIDAFFSDPEKVMKAAGLDLYIDTTDAFNPSSAADGSIPVKLFRNSSNPSVGTTTNNGTTSNNNKELFKCRICYDETSNAFSMGCGHKFCRSCYEEYLSSQVKDGPSCILAHCPEFKCTQTVTPNVFHNLLCNRYLDNMNSKSSSDINNSTTSNNITPNKSTTNTTTNSSNTSTSTTNTSTVPVRLSRVYDNYYIKNFIETRRDMKYCPAPGCEKVAVGSGVTTVRCACNYPFCMRCGEEAHDPCSCAQLAEWALKCINESETANWILANTRKCPACNARIEKNQGCNHMSCRLCKHEFCWICMGAWAEHGQQTGGFYKCNKFMPAEVKSVISAIDKAKADLDRYLHYYQRYHGHESALKYASNQRIQAEARMVEQQEVAKTSWIDVQFLKQAAEQVIDCRRVLKYTYVLGFFLADHSPEKQLFEHHQEMLEKNTERLQEYTEVDLEQIDRTQVVNLTRVTEKFMTSLLASMAGGVVTLHSDLTATPVLPASAAPLLPATLQTTRK